MTKSDYTYEKQTHKGIPYILIEDLNQGGMSVTNDMENVLQQIAKELKTSLDSTIIIYKDSDGVYDGVYTTQNKVGFILLRTKSIPMAITVSDYWRKSNNIG